MDSSSDDEGVITHRKSKGMKMLDSDDDDIDVKAAQNQVEATEDFVLRLSDEDDDDDSMHGMASVKAKIEASLTDPHVDSASDRNLASPMRRSDIPSSSITLDTECDLLSEALPKKEQNNHRNKVAIGFKFIDKEDVMKKLNALADSDSESDIDEDLESQPQSNMTVKFGAKSCESDADSENDQHHNSMDVENKECLSKSKSKKSKPRSERKSKTIAKNAMLEIKAESQRQLRQSSIGLPYHVPKQRSLSEFLNRRKSLSNMPVKGSAEQLTAVWKEIEDREKEAEEFYKSESDKSESDSESDESETPQSDKLPEKSEVTDLDGEESCSIINSEANLGVTVNDPTKKEDMSHGKSLMCINTSAVQEGLEGDFQHANSPKNCDDSGSKPEHSGMEVDTSPTNIGNHSKLSEKNVSSDVTPCEASVELDHAISDTEKNRKVCGASYNNPLVENKTSLALKMNADASIAAHIAETSFKNQSSNLISAEDSQDISLHYSETQGLHEIDVNLSKNVLVPKEVTIAHENKTSDIPKISGNVAGKNSFPSKDQNEMCVNKQLIVNDVKWKVNGENEAKQSLTWEELNAAMKFSDDEQESENFPIAEHIAEKKIQGSGPRLSLKGAPDDVIDLDDVNPNMPRTPGVKSLIERFMKHSASKKKGQKAQTVELNLISSEKDTVGGVVDVKHETLKVVLLGDKDTCSEHQKPGGRLKLLKDELNRQMRKQKEEEWQKKQEEMKNEQMFRGEKDDCGMLPDEDEEEEVELTDSESESEPEINDCREPKKKKKFKSLFVDEEAEVEDDNDDDVGSDERGDSDDDVNGDCGEDDVCNGAITDDDENIKEKVVSDRTSGKARENSFLIESQEEGKENNMAITGDLRCTMTSADLFASQSTEWRVDDDDDDFIPAGQPNGVARHENIKEKPDDARDKQMLFSPMSLSIPGKRPSFMDADSELTPTKFLLPMDAKTPNSIKKLFSEPEISGTQEKLDELAGLFAGKFNDSQDGILKLANTTSNTESETDLMALCSGKFMTQLPQPEDLEGDCAQSPLSGSEFLSQTQNVEPSQASTLPVEDSQDFSLKWNEEGTSKAQDEDTVTKAVTKKLELEIMSSDEENDSLNTKGRKKKYRKLDFSDDEDNDLENGYDKETSDGSEGDECDSSKVTTTEGEKLFGVFQKPTKEVFYDSDENEIEPSDFFEKEAELSDEEDWQGSEDEDEKGLDQLEMDEADKEDIDQDVVREQLVKNHMQKMLDEDRRDVRILKEMLFEDGELHSDAGGRERQFRWKNVDSTGMGDNGRQSDDEHGDNDDEEDDAEWRKQRHEREMFLKEQREKQKNESGEHEDDEILENSELLQLGKAVLCKSRTNSLDMTGSKESQVVKPTVNNQLLSPDAKRSNTLLTKRGSFLSRGDSVLAKLAKLTGPSKENVLAGAKHSGNFVFTAVSPTKKESQTDEHDTKSVKRKASVGIANPKDKKPCLTAPVRKGSGLFDQL